LIQADGLIAARDAPLVWVSTLAKEAEQALWFGGDEARWMRTIDDEDANVRAAFEWAIDRGEVSAAVWILFGIFGWLTGRGRARDGVEMAQRVLEQGPTGSDLAMTNFLLMCCQSNAGITDANVVAAAGHTAHLLAQTRQPWLALVTEAYVAAWSYPQGDQQAAADCGKQCAAIIEQLRSYPPAVRSWALQPLLWAHLDAGHLDEARRAADEGLDTAAAAGLSFAESRMALNRARIALAQNELDEAWRDAEHAAVVARRTGEPFVVSVATQLLADVSERRGEPERARDLLLSVLDDVAESQPSAAVAALRERIAVLN